MAALFFPWAIWSSTSRSRSVSWASGEWASRSLRETRPSTTFGSRTEPPRLTSRSARTSSSRSATRSFSRYPSPAAPSFRSSYAYSSSAYWERTTTPISGCSMRIRRAASIPSVVWVGGIRISVRTMSGFMSSTAASSDSRSVTVATRSISSTSSSSAAVPARTR